MWMLGTYNILTHKAMDEKREKIHEKHPSQNKTLFIKIKKKF